MTQDQFDAQVDRFILHEIETVPHLEALLLIWNTRPQPWTAESLSQRLYISPNKVHELLDDLVRRFLIVLVPGKPSAYRYAADSQDKDQLLAAVNETYRRELVRVSTMIHSKPSAAVREFAQAFRITKERK